MQRSSGVLTHLSRPPACHRTETWPRGAGAVPAALVGPLSVSGATTCNALHFQSVNAIFVQIPKNAGSALSIDAEAKKLLSPAAPAEVSTRRPKRWVASTG